MVNVYPTFVGSFWGDHSPKWPNIYKQVVRLLPTSPRWVRLDDLKTKRDSADVLCMTSGWKTLPWMATMISGDMAMHIMCFCLHCIPCKHGNNQPMQPSLSSPQPFISYSMSLQNLWNSFPTGNLIFEHGVLRKRLSIAEKNWTLRWYLRKYCKIHVGYDMAIWFMSTVQLVQLSDMAVLAGLRQKQFQYMPNETTWNNMKQHETTTSTKLDMEHHATPKLELHGFEQGRFYWITGSMMIHHGGLLLVGPQLLNKESMVQMVIEWYWPIIAGMTLHLSPLMGERRIRLVWWKKTDVSLPISQIISWTCYNVWWWNPCLCFIANSSSWWF